MRRDGVIPFWMECVGADVERTISASLTFTPLA